MTKRTCCLLVAMALLAAGLGLSAQTRFTYSSGQSVSPAFEGWWQNEDGTYSLFFGYMNSNWEEELDVPVGPDNHIEPGGPDRGQPTHFYPRRNMFLFTVDVPADFGDQEVVWTLTTNGRTERAYGSLRTDYLLDPQTIGTEMGANFGGRHRRMARQPVPDPGPRRGPAAPRARGRAAAAGGVRVRRRHPFRHVRAARSGARPAAPGLPSAESDRARQPARLAVRLDRLPRGRLEGHVLPRAAEDVAGHARVRELALVLPLPDSARSRGRQVGDRRDLRRGPAPTCCAPWRATAR